jgi:hypothetical protein
MVYRNHWNEKEKKQGKKAVKQNRRCLICDTDKTNVGSIHPITKKEYPRWHRYENGYICNTCKFRVRYDQTKERGNQMWLMMEAVE